MRAALIQLMRLFPLAFRQEFGPEIAAQIAQEYDAAHARGALALVWFVVATAFDIVKSAAAERWNPAYTLTAPDAAAPFREATMRSTLQDWGRDLRFAVRTLRRTPGFTAVAAGTLALAIGANAAMFGVVDTVLLNPLPYGHVDRLVTISGTAPGSQLPKEFGVGEEFYLYYKEQSKLLEDVTIFQAGTSTFRTEDRVERISMAWAPTSMYSTLGAKPILGRLPTDGDEERVALMSYVLWKTWFGGDSTVLGRTYEMSGSKREVIGIMGPEFRFPSDETRLWLAYPVRAAGLVPGRLGNGFIARKKPGVTDASLANELTMLSKRLPAKFGGSASYARLIEQHRAVVHPFKEAMLGGVAKPLWILLAAVGIVLLIACANVTNLFLVRTEGRHRELALRLAVGAGRAQLIRLQLSEALVVAGIAAIAAMALAWVGLPTFLHAAPEGIPRISDLKFNASTLVFTFAAAIVAALACGLIPAIRASSPRLSRLRESSRSSTRQRHWTRDGLVVAQASLALVLLIGSGLLFRSFTKLSNVDPGYSTKDIFTFQVAPSGPQFQKEPGPAFARFHMDMMERLRALPGVQVVGAVDNIPLNEGTGIRPFRVEGASDDPGAYVRLNYTSAAGDYYKAMGIKLLRGESFPSRDFAATMGKVVISKSAAERLWKGENPIGRRLQAQGDTVWETVIGVVADVMQYGFRDTAQSTIYLPLIGHTPTSRAVGSPAYVVKTSRAEVIAPEVRALVKQVAPNAPMYRVYTMAGLARDSMVQLSFTMLTLGIVSVLAMILGAVGLYGVLSYIVAARTKEIGVRMALGAESGQVRRMVVAQGAKVVAIGVVIGIAVALASTRALGSLLFGVATFDLTTFVAMSLSMVLVGLLASYLPARRASTVDPMESLRGD